MASPGVIAFGITLIIGGLSVIGTSIYGIPLVTIGSLSMAKTVLQMCKEMADKQSPVGKCIGMVCSVLLIAVGGIFEYKKHMDGQISESASKSGSQMNDDAIIDQIYAGITAIDIIIVVVLITQLIYFCILVWSYFSKPPPPPPLSFTEKLICGLSGTLAVGAVAVGILQLMGSRRQR